MNTSVQQLICLVKLSVKRVVRERLVALLPLIIAVILGVACRYNKAGLPAGIMLVGVVSGVTTIRQLWIDRATHFYDCVQSAGADAGIQIAAAFITWIMATLGLGFLVFILARA